MTFLTASGAVEMMIVTVANSNDERSATGTAQTTEPDVIIAREGSELACRLRSSGWIARSGWRSRSSARQSEWLVRFVLPRDAADRLEH